MRTHNFQPNRYFHTIGPHEPVLWVQPGDRVETTTVDALGNDMGGNPVTTGSNPQTGPFYINGAEPGDTIIVRFERITPNRALGWASQDLAAHVVDPYPPLPNMSHLPTRHQSELASWEVDIPSWTVMLNSPETRLGRLILPMEPFLGCFGVAPAGHQAISTATSGPYGGNMDYRGFVAGSTVYLPVSEPGALFFLGDGHAVQGDGEIGGTGVEISMDVVLQFDLIKGKTIFWPRGEDSEYIFTLGNARPLEQALQHATSEMVRWLQSEWKIDGPGIGLLMAQTVRYEIGNVFDPAYTIVCKIPKRWLERIVR